MRYAKELDAALEAAARAATRILDLYATFVAIPDAPVDISTQADRDSQELILQTLQHHFPDDALCAEEATPTLAAANRSGPRTWVVDPIDGSRGFAQKNGEFSIMIALVDSGKVVLGVVHEPAVNRLTYAVQGEGCWRRDGSSPEPIRCHVSKTDVLVEATLTQSRSKPGMATRQVQRLRPGKVHESHSAGVKLARVARGEADLYVLHYSLVHDWDIAAGHVLVEEAGGRVTGLRGQTIRYGQEDACQREGLLASNEVLHDAALIALVGAF